MSEDKKKRLIENLAGALAAVSRDDIIEKSIGHFRNADRDYGERLANAIQARRERDRGADITTLTDRDADVTLKPGKKK